jgi:putative flavoprotein involved in K+ transport
VAGDTNVIIGAGPAGLAVAACLRAQGRTARIVDRAGAPGGAYREIFDGMTLASPAVFNALPGLPLAHAGEYTTVPEYRAYLERYAAHHRLDVERGTVERVERAPAGSAGGGSGESGGGGARGTRFRVVVDGSPADASAVVVATGCWSFPVWPRLPPFGPDVEVIHARDWRGPTAHRAGPVLVIGGGTSAVEIAEQAAAAGRAVHVCARSGVKLFPRRILGRDVHHWFAFLAHVPPWLARRYCANPSTHAAGDTEFSRLRDAGRVHVCSGIRAADGATVELDDGVRATVALVVAATGQRFETPFLPPEVARAPGGQLLARACESVSWPGLFVVGAPCAGHLESEFLRGIARDAPRVAGRIAAAG